MTDMTEHTPDPAAADQTTPELSEQTAPSQIPSEGASAHPAPQANKLADASEDQADDADGDADNLVDEDHLHRLEEEGDIAADYLEELLDIADLDGDIDIDVDGDRASVEIRGADQLSRLNEPKGELLDALQELARLAVQTRTGNRSRLMLDIGGFRAQHKEDLEALGQKAVEEARETGAPVALRPMNPFERKVVHDVAKRAGLVSESDGDGRGRHVVIYPAS